MTGCRPGTSANPRRTCFTLFLCIAGGISWVEVVNVLEQVNPWLVPILSLYVAFAVFCVLNIVTGVFVERSTSMRLMDEENMMFDELESRKKWLKEIKVLFNEADTDQSGQINWSEFYAVMTDFQAQTCLKHLGFDTSRVTAQQLWNLIDYDNSGQIDINEFTDALMKLHGTAGAIDLARLRHEVTKLFKVLKHLNDNCQDQFREIKEKMNEPLKSARKTVSAVTGTQGADRLLI
ncbi:Voltage-dependent R-type calcium channel subunit alpha-1E [Durusdinium trenchii]|uniref:Voltage-dependent R-type calcium channel subunit alpha-1E n=1 Tax=Durusdinium trenchii TaxID=1381693 RepID=A0ABP0RH87_9DINO